MQISLVQGRRGIAKGEAGKTCWVISMMLWNLQNKCTEKLFYNKSSTLSLSKSQSFRRSWFFMIKFFWTYCSNYFANMLKRKFFYWRLAGQWLVEQEIRQRAGLATHWEDQTAKGATEWNPLGCKTGRPLPNTLGGTHHKNARVRGEAAHMVGSEMNCVK